MCFLVYSLLVGFRAIITILVDLVNHFLEISPRPYALLFLATENVSGDLASCRLQVLFNWISHSPSLGPEILPDITFLRHWQGYSWPAHGWSEASWSSPIKSCLDSIKLEFWSLSSFLPHCNGLNYWTPYYQTLRSAWLLSSNGFLYPAALLRHSTPWLCHRNTPSPDPGKLDPGHDFGCWAYCNYCCCCFPQSEWDFFLISCQNDSYVFGFCTERVPWNVADYVSRLPSGRSQPQTSLEEALSSTFPPGPDLAGTPAYLDIPATIVDTKGNILVWCLQDVISQSAKVDLSISTIPGILLMCLSQSEWAKSMDLLDKVMGADSRNKPVADGAKNKGKPKKSWRRQPAYFHHGEILRPGLSDWASCWFQAGHSVCLFS